jgi:SPP1 gp7 family putative phage head morphogenesis protein
LIPFSLTPAGEERPSLDSFGRPGDDGDEKEEKSLKARGGRKWIAFANMTSPLEKAMARIMTRYFEQQQSEVMKNVAKFRSVQKDMFTQIIFSLKDWNEKLKTMALNSTKEAFVGGLIMGANEVGLQLDFDLLDPKIERILDQRLAWFAENVNASTADLVKEAINEGFQNGESIEGISRRIDEVYGYSRDFRSKRIAQTEVIGSANQGQWQSYKDAGVEKKKWSSAGDNKVRDSHRSNQVVDINDPFSIGGAALMYPGDRSMGAPAEEVINCRCTLVPVI